MSYDPATIQRFYDGYGDREWQRFDARAQDRVNLHIHTSYLHQFVQPGMHVLDAGAGPGRERSMEERFCWPSCARVSTLLGPELGE